MVQKTSYNYEAREISTLARSIVEEVVPLNITAALVESYRTVGIIPPSLWTESRGAVLFDDNAALWAAIAKYLHQSRRGNKLNSVAKVLHAAVPSAYGYLGSAVAPPFREGKELWAWLRQGMSWGAFVRYLLNSGVKVGDENGQLPSHIAAQADRSRVQQDSIELR